MSPQVTFKSNEDKTPQAGVDASGRPVPPAPRLCDAVRIAYAPSHGAAPSEMPLPPVGLEDLGPAAAIRVVGPEREKWMQGMQSNDLSAAPYGGAVAAAFLGGKGRLIALALLWRRRDEIIVTTEPGRLDALRAHLDKLLIMEDCEMQEAPELRRLRYWPADVPPRMVPAHITGSEQPLGFELLLPEAEAQSLLESLRERPRPDLAEAFRIAAGVPKWGAELDEETTPIEAGLDPLISFTKGCYVGQEVVAMATYRGRVAWNLVRLEAPGAAPAPGTKLGAGGKGRVTSSTQVGGSAVMLGYVHKELIVPGSGVPLEDGRTARVLGLPCGSMPGAGVCA
ncbi:MAG: CAF17-like 4Fe-4S cluster assembly/insertion protein YgfZ [Myxococcales bacterium]